MDFKERKEKIQKEFDDIEKRMNQMNQQLIIGKSRLDQLAGQFKLIEELEREGKNKEEG